MPQHSTETEELRPQLQLLMAHFGIDYNLEDLKNPANEMELFSLVTEMCFFILRGKTKKPLKICKEVPFMTSQCFVSWKNKVMVTFVLDRKWQKSLDHSH